MALAVPKNIRLHIRHDLANAKFPLASRAKAEELLVRRVRYARVIRRRSEAKTTSQAISGANVLAKRSRGRPNQTQWREYLIAGIMRG